MLPLDQMAVDRIHRLVRALGAARAGQHRPALRNRIDPAFRTGRAAKPRAVGKVRAPIPVAAPALALEAVAQRPCLRVAAMRERGVPVAVGELAEARQHVEQKEPEPDALAAAARPDVVHAVVPVARADERQPALTEPQPALDRSYAVLVEARMLGRADRQVVVRLLLG